MVKKKPHASLQGKKPTNTAKVGTKVMRNPGHINNRLKRSEMYGKYLQQKKDDKKRKRIQKLKEAEALGEEETVKKTTPKTLDNTRETEPTMVFRDEEVAADEAEDEFARYFYSETPPKVLITTRPRPSNRLFYFIADLQHLVPSLHFYPRKQYSVKEICQFASNREFTHLIVLSENAKHCNGMTISHLGNPKENGLVGPTAFFKISNVVTSKNIPNHGASTHHIPELNLHGFGTRLGHRVGRLLGSLFPHDAEFVGRQVVTFHNQRDYIFVRHHRYMLEEKKVKPSKGSKSNDKEPERPLGIRERVKARLQELGPRFTLKLRWVQEGTFDTQFGEYEWVHKRKEMDTSRRRFHL